MEKIMINEMVSLTDEGIFVKDKQILPIVIRDVELLHNYSISTSSPVITCSYGIVNVSLSIYHTFRCSYSPETPLASLKELKNNGIVINDKSMVLAILAAIFKYFNQDLPSITESSDPPVKKIFIADHSGWIHAREQWVYLTSGFGITKDGIDEHWHCTAQNAYLHYDSELTAKDAYIQLLKVLTLDFDSAALILTSSVLSLLKPLQSGMNLYPIPGLLISGPTSCGKTELATGLTRILTNKNDTLSNLFILQNSIKDLKRITNGLSDSTIILDDIRQSPSYSLREKISAALDSFIRTCFSSNNENFLLPVITGEDGTLDRMPLSLRNRIIELPLNTSPESIRDRQELIAELHKSSLLICTFFRHFIQYLANCFSCDSFFYNLSDLEESFFNIIQPPERKSRGYDNLYLSYLAFHIFLEYGKQQDIAPDTRGNNTAQDMLSKNCFREKYIAILKNTSDRQNILDPNSQAMCLLLCLLKPLRIYIAEVLDRASYKLSNSYCLQRRCNTYGHHAILDLTQDHCGVFLESTDYLSDYRKNYNISRTLLIIHYDTFAHQYSEYSEMCQKMRQHLPYSSFTNFLTNLHTQHILLGKSRHDQRHPDYVNHKMAGYPCYIYKGNQVQCETTSVLVFNLDGKLKQEVEAMCSCDYRFHGQNYSDFDQVKSCSSILQSLV